MPREPLPDSTAPIGLGSNLDDPVGQVRSALDELDSLPRTRVTARSSLYRTAPIGRRRPARLHQCRRPCWRPQLSARELLAEPARHRSTARRACAAHRNAPRTLDLDLLLLRER